MEPNSPEDLVAALTLYDSNEASKVGQFADAVSFYNAVATQYGENNIATITGHSLGGGLAQYIASIEGQTAYTYNAMCVNGSAGSSNITNFVVMNDYASNNGTHIGSTYYIMPVALSTNPMENSHCDPIWAYNTETYGPVIDKPAGFTDNQALSLWYYDVKNTGFTASVVKNHIQDQVSEAYLQEAVTIINNLHQYIEKPLHYRISSSDIIIGTDQADGSDSLTGSSQADTIYGNGGNDTVHTGGGNDVIYLGSGDDTVDAISQPAGSYQLYGEAGDDFISGGTGEDIVSGVGGNNTFLFNLGDGHDTIWNCGESYNINTLRFGAGISSENVVFTRQDDGLKITFTNSSDVIDIPEQYITMPGHTIARFEYDSGSSNQGIQNFNLDNSELSNTSYMSSSDLNLLIQNMAAYDPDYSAPYNQDSTQSNQDLITLLAA